MITVKQRPSPRTRTPEQRKTRAERRRIEAELAMADHRKAQRVFHANYERLKAERLAREAAGEEY